MSRRRDRNKKGKDWEVRYKGNSRMAGDWLVAEGELMGPLCSWTVTPKGFLMPHRRWEPYSGMQTMPVPQDNPEFCSERPASPLFHRPGITASL